MSKENKLQAFKLETLGLISSGIAHDINNLLSIIEGHCEILSNEYPEFQGKEHIRSISDAVMRGGELARQILTLSKHLPHNPESLSSKEVVNSAVEMVEHVLPENVELDYTLASESYIKVDATSLIQVIINLVTNAVENLENKTGRVSILLTESELQEVAIEITSDGEQASAIQLTRQYDPFSQSPNLGKTNGAGTSLIQNIVREMDGKIEIKTDQEYGTSITLKFPLCPNKHEKLQEMNHLDSTEINDINTLLLVEDDEQLAAIYQDLMLNAGFVVTHAQNGVEGYKQYVQQGPFDVVLTDEEMPLRRGSEMARMIQKLNGEQLIILLSGFADEKIDACVQENVVKCALVKPVKLTALVETINQYLTS